MVKNGSVRKLAQAVFNNTVSEKYSFSLTGEELEEMNAMTVRAYAECRGQSENSVASNKPMHTVLLI